MLSLLGGIFMGWALGANDASNVFGTAVGARMVKFWTATFLASVFVVLGAVISGRAGIETLQGLTSFELSQAVIASVAAALSVSIMTLAGWPVSTSQAVIGAIIGIGIMNHQINLAGLGKVLACWFTTPLGGALISFTVYKVLAFFYNRLEISLFTSDRLLKIGFVIFGSYGAYALGANNVANVTAVFVGAGKLTVFQAALIGGVSIALGILTFSRHVMETVGQKLVELDPFSALMVSISLAITIHIYTIIGVPVSSSQAIIGGLLGIGIIKGTSTVSLKTLKGIFLAWFLTPVLACALALFMVFVSFLEYVGP
ncbi:inorganic phosphate transporter [Desulfospira joergensenii]|uniref:inorganic phosphate transporter n=1 Tax=Desulfospira joergensenii TaxID=53329 RepID=UPI0003B66967|nr:inorganic phosphate transporter [Desulfospira joergensenii]